MTTRIPARLPLNKKPMEFLIFVYTFPAVGNGFDNGRKIIIRQNHCRSILGNLRPRNAHCNADVCLLEGRGHRSRHPPVIAVMQPFSCHARTMRILCSGETRARKPKSAVPFSSAPRPSCAPALPLQRQGRPSCKIPIFFAIAEAVTLWSPVIITGRIPARRQLATAAADSSRGGSIMAIRPTKVRSFSSSNVNGRVFGQCLFPQRQAHEAPPQKKPQSVHGFLWKSHPPWEQRPFLPSQRTPSQKHIRRTLGQKRGFSGNFVQGGHQLSVRIKGQLLQTGGSPAEFRFHLRPPCGKMPEGRFRSGHRFVHPRGWYRHCKAHSPR